eukprot:4759191-Amphidinium_carterae.1
MQRIVCDALSMWPCERTMIVLDPCLLAWRDVPVDSATTPAVHKPEFFDRFHPILSSPSQQCQTYPEKYYISSDFLASSVSHSGAPFTIDFEAVCAIKMVVAHLQLLVHAVLQQPCMRPRFLPGSANKDA